MSTIAPFPYSYTDSLLSELRAIWEYSRVSNYALYKRYYGGDHPWENVVSKAMRKQIDSDGDEEFSRFWKPANMAYVLVEEAVGYWAGAKVHAYVSQAGERDVAKSELVTAQLRSLFYNEREEVARAQSLYGEGILRVRTPAKGMLKGYGVAPYQAGPWCMTFCEDPDDPYRVTQCVYQFIRGDWLWAQHITASEIRLLKVAHLGATSWGRSRAAAASLAGVETLGEVTNTTRNPWGVVPIYSFMNGNGASDLFPIINAQDSLNKAIYNLEASAEYHGFPLLEVRGYAGRTDDDGVPMDIDVSPGSYIKVDEKGGLKRLEAADLKQLLDAESRGYLRVAQQGRSPAVLAEYSGLGDSGRVPSFLLEPLKMRLNSKLSGAKHALELLARDLPRYGLSGSLELDEYQVDIEIEMPIPTDKIGEAESRAREVDVGGMTGQQAARLRGEDPAQYLAELEAELSMKATIQEKAKAAFAPKPQSGIIQGSSR